LTPQSPPTGRRETALAPRGSPPWQRPLPPASPRAVSGGHCAASRAVGPSTSTTGTLRRSRGKEKTTKEKKEGGTAGGATKARERRRRRRRRPRQSQRDAAETLLLLLQLLLLLLLEKQQKTRRRRRQGPLQRFLLPPFRTRLSRRLRHRPPRRQHGSTIRLSPPPSLLSTRRSDDFEREPLEN
jgi:hypothetical protein